MSNESFTSAEFYRYLGRNEFMATRCNACQKVFLPPRPICTKCFSTDMNWVKLSGKGKLRAFTCITVGPSFMVSAGYDRKNPYCCGIVALEEGPQVSGQILGVNPREPDHIKIGSPVTLEIIAQGEGDSKRLWLGFKAQG